MEEVMQIVKLASRTGLLSLVGLGLGSFCLCACGTLRSDGGLYGGVRSNCKEMYVTVTEKPKTEDMGSLASEIVSRPIYVAALTIDTPLSFVFDTVLIPFQIAEMFNKSLGKAPVPATDSDTYPEK